MNTDVEYMESKGWLPDAVALKLRQFKPSIEEVRLRADGAASVTVGGRNMRIGVSCTQSELENTLAALCSGSLHSHGESLKNGYIDLGGGWRAGVCGQAIHGGTDALTVKKVTSVSIRVPHFIPDAAAGLYGKIALNSRPLSVLICSPPGEGKTTLLRDLAVRLSRGEHPFRTVLIDTRGELYDPKYMSGGLLDVYTGYPKAAAIGLAVRTMNPECLICDELGTADETDALLDVQNTGVPLIASTHASDIAGMLRRPKIRRLHDARVFELYVLLKRRGNSFEFRFIKPEEADG